MKYIFAVKFERRRRHSPETNHPTTSLPVKQHDKLESYMPATPVGEKWPGATQKAGCEPVGKIHHTKSQTTKY